MPDHTYGLADSNLDPTLLSTWLPHCCVIGQLAFAEGSMAGGVSISGRFVDRWAIPSRGS